MQSHPVHADKSELYLPRDSSFFLHEWISSSFTSNVYLLHVLRLSSILQDLAVPHVLHLSSILQNLAVCWFLPPHMALVSVPAFPGGSRCFCFIKLLLPCLYLSQLGTLIPSYFLQHLHRFLQCFHARFHCSLFRI